MRVNAPISYLRRAVSILLLWCIVTGGQALARDIRVGVYANAP